jgi:predicted DNA-binding protein (UPF0251 family)
MTMNLYRVVVTQKWSAEAEALVWAPDRGAAEKLAATEVELDLDDAEAIRPVAIARPEPIDDAVLDRMDDDELWLILPDGKVCDNSRTGLTQFQALLTPERLEALRIAQIEAGNGQLDLLEVAP